MLNEYSNIRVAGGDTSTPINTSKRIAYIGKFLIAAKSKVIDCGCGEGKYVLSLLKNYSVGVFGIEYQEEKVLCTQKIPELQGKIIHGDIEHIPCSSNCFDIALLNEVIEHISDEKKALSEIYRVLAHQGLVIIIAPNRWFPFEAHGVNWKRSRRKVPHWVPLIPYVPLSLGNKVFVYWARNYWQSEMVNLIRSANFVIIERMWMWQTFENISGHQPNFIYRLRSVLRVIANLCERIPIIRRFGTSQVIVGKKM